jgi:hypothetical protein
MFDAAKDALTSQTFRVWANNRFVRYGTVQDLKIDSRRKTAEATFLLNGEAAPIAIRIGNYQVDSESGKTFLRTSAVTCTRPWLNNLLADFGQSRRIEIPSWAAHAL